MHSCSSLEVFSNDTAPTLELFCGEAAHHGLMGLKSSPKALIGQVTAMPGGSIYTIIHIHMYTHTRIHVDACLYM